MIAAHRRRTDKIQRENVMIDDNPADFPPESPVGVITVEINTKLEDFLQHDADLVSAHGDKLQAREIKDDTRDNLLEAFREIGLGAVAIGDRAVPGITARYIMPHPRTDQNLISSADAWFADTAPHEELFKTAGVNPNFRNNLIAAKDDFQQARDDADSADEKYGEAVGALDALMREIMELSRRRSALVKLKYKNNPGKLAAWAIASHLEKPPKRTPKS